MCINAFDLHWGPFGLRVSSSLIGGRFKRRIHPVHGRSAGGGGVSGVVGGD